MQITNVILKNGTEYSGQMMNYRPVLGYFTLIDSNVPNRILFSDCASVKTSECDEIARAKEYMRLMRVMGWSDFDDNWKPIKPPENKYEWE